MQTVRTQDIPAYPDRRDFYALDPDYVTQPEGRIRPSRPVVVSLVVLRVYVLVLFVLLAYRVVRQTGAVP